LETAGKEAERKQAAFDETQSDTWKARAETAEKALNDEKSAHQAYRDEVTQAKATEAKNKAFMDAVTAWESKDKAKINPKQTDLLLATLGGKAEFTEKDGAFSVKNLDAIMTEAAAHGGFDFAKPETRTAFSGTFQKTNANTQPPAGGTNINSGMNALIRGGSAVDD
jgi:hypothetical protein